MYVFLGIATNWIDFAAISKPASLIKLVWSPWSLEGKLSFSIFLAKVKRFKWLHGMNSMDGLSCLAWSIVGRSLCVDICLEVPLQLIYARPCNWLVIPWPQLGYSSISILCYTLSHALPQEIALSSLFQRKSTLKDNICINVFLDVNQIR